MSTKQIVKPEGFTRPTSGVKSTIKVDMNKRSGAFLGAFFLCRNCYTIQISRVKRFDMEAFNFPH